MKPGVLGRRDVAIAMALYVGAFASLFRVARGLGLAEGEGAALDRIVASGSRFAALHWSDRLTDLRLSVVLVTSLLPVASYLLLRATFAWPVAAAGASLALFAPRAAVEMVTANGDGPAAAWIAVAVAAYAWAERSRARVALSVVASVALALALTKTLAALALLPALCLDHAMARRARAELLAAKGQLPVPLALVLLPVAVVVIFAWNDPAIVKQPFERVRELMLVAGAPEIARSTWAGEAPMPDTIPRFHAAAMLLLALPSLTSVLAIVGVLRVVHAPRGERVTTLAAMSLVVLIAYPLVVPPGLGRFPGRFALAVPFAAVLATSGALVVGRAAARWLREPWAVLALASVVAAASFVPHPATLGACFPAIAGGATRARANASVPFVDGTELGGLLPAIDAMGLADATIFAPSVPPDTWEHYRKLGRLRTRVRAVGSRPHARLSIDDGRAASARDKPVVTLRRDGATVACLYAHSPAL